VVYNGAEPWNAPTDLRDLIEDVPDVLKPYLPCLKAIVVAENRFSEAHLESMQNFVAMLFRFENTRIPDKNAFISKVQALLLELIDLFKDQPYDSLQHHFIVWLRRVFLHARLPDVQLTEMTELQEMHSMLYETVQEMYRKIEQEAAEKARTEAMAEGIAIGTEKGIAIGKEEGIAIGTENGFTKGQVRTLLKQLKGKFGELDDDIQEKVEKLDINALDECTQRILFANTIDEVFTDITKH